MAKLYWKYKTNGQWVWLAASICSNQVMYTPQCECANCSSQKDEAVE